MPELEQVKKTYAGKLHTFSLEIVIMYGILAQNRASQEREETKCYSSFFTTLTFVSRAIALTLTKGMIGTANPALYRVWEIIALA